MACAAHDQPELIEAYLLGQIDEPAREAFETHLFGCDRCLAHLRMLEELQTELRAQAPAIRSAPLEPERRVPWPWLAAAASIAIVAGLTAWRLTIVTPSQPVAPGPAATTTAAVSPEIVATLSRVDPPRYVALDVRGAETVPEFDAAMRAYAAGNYAAAADGLRRVRGSAARDPQVDFFYAVSLLMTEDARGAIDPLRRVIAYGESPYRQLASLYLGKALVRVGDFDGADAEWTRTRQLPGTHARDADDLLNSLRSGRRAR